MKALNHARRDAVLNYVQRDMGFTSLDALLAHAMTRPCPGVCIECHSICDDVEPDARDNWCECCHGQHVKSVLVLAELV